MKPSENHVSEIEDLVTYGLLTEKKFVRVIGIKAFFPEKQLSVSSDFSKGDKLVIGWHKTTDTLLKTTITLKEYLFEISTMTGQNNIPKDIFLGVIVHSSQPVFVKIFHTDRPKLPFGNIFLPIEKVEKKALPSIHGDITPRKGIE
ncbi:hypothetical protein FDP41_010488 [Naegleria fowleri]|uniref:Uncharacterized protein n=1 Tax=Naegleria fowleri TaxID=5763 RepID=A0A6A5BZ53_NAEFO|nr:uncharacterized protein FDP41_010488 [Naegleria fowleri]KAF0983423.1 hypothetical protein FDP41_010488 [Naegleria fowleri]